MWSLGSSDQSRRNCRIGNASSKCVGVGFGLLWTFVFFSSRRRHTRYWRDWSSDVCSSDLLPMLLVAYAYRELNRVAPDCGTSFTWTTKAFNPYVGWLCGWGALLATVIVLSNLAGVAVSFFYLLLGEITGSESVATLGDNTVVNALTCVVFVAVATWITYRGVEEIGRAHV